MPKSWNKICGLDNLYVAYRKAKAEAFYENTHFHALAFTTYEQHLDLNLRRLRSRLTEPTPNWQSDLRFLGDHAYLPKSVDCSEWESDSEGHFRALDPLKDWQQRFKVSGRKAPASLRLVIRPTVDFQIVSALWIIFVGHLFDAQLDRGTSFGNRLRRSFNAPKDVRVQADVNLETPGLFEPYFSAYRNWREGGLSSMTKSLENGRNILAITMDVEKFYHRVSPIFLLRPAFLEYLELKLMPFERRLTFQLLEAIDTWHKSTPAAAERSDCAIPVGLSASKIIANVLLSEFDRSITVNVKPIYYGRYVDDVFLVIEASGADNTAASVMTRLAQKLGPIVQVERNGSKSNSISVNLPYAEDSKIVFSGSKQKIFALSSAHGSDLVHRIRDQIRQQSSEYRLLPEIPEAGARMASRALLATPNAVLQADALRKADVISVRRLGFALLLGDFETYASDLQPGSWAPIRKEFFELVRRHVVTPIGFFEFFSYIPRVFGLMLSCGDTKQAKGLIRGLSTIAKLLKSTTTLGNAKNKGSLALCLEQYACALLQAGVQAATVRSVALNAAFLGTLQGLKELDDRIRIPKGLAELETLRKRVLLADWGRRSYKEFWHQEQDSDEPGPELPKSKKIREQLRLLKVREFQRTATDLRVPHWPALAFPTRPLRVDEIGLVAPKVLSDPVLFRHVILSLRGAKVASRELLGFEHAEKSAVARFSAPGTPKRRVRIAVASWQTTERQWLAAAEGSQDQSAERYVAFNSLINRIISEPERPDYIALPELGIPLRWALRAARKLAASGISLLAGVEYHRDRLTRKLRNDCLVSLTTRWPGYVSSIALLQSKFEAAHHERSGLAKLRKKREVLHVPTGECAKPTIYEHCGLYFSALICSDLTNISHRRDLRGEIDLLFVLEWNQDTKTFASIVEATANDLHVFVVQANNRLYGDSRIRSPAAKDYARDVVQVKGGVSDYFVVGEIDFKRLRLEQRRRNLKSRQFKPIPVGFKTPEHRR